LLKQKEHKLVAIVLLVRTEFTVNQVLESNIKHPFLSLTAFAVNLHIKVVSKG
jgi:hypothetical protein